MKGRAMRRTGGRIGSPPVCKNNALGPPTTIIATDVFENPPRTLQHVHNFLTLKKWSDLVSGAMQPTGSKGCRNGRAWIGPGPRQVRRGSVEYSTAPWCLAPYSSTGNSTGGPSWGTGGFGEGASRRSFLGHELRFRGLQHRRSPIEIKLRKL